MKIKRSAEQMLGVWPRRTTNLPHVEQPILYVTDGAGLVLRAYPNGTDYEWELDPKPSEEDFLVTYPFAHRVTDVSL